MEELVYQAGYWAQFSPDLLSGEPIVYQSMYIDASLETRIGLDIFEFLVQLISYSLKVKGFWKVKSVLRIEN